MNHVIPILEYGDEDGGAFTFICGNLRKLIKTKSEQVFLYLIVL